MGYHYEDFYEDYVKEPLKHFMSGNPDPDEFLRFFKRILMSNNGQLLSRQFLNIISEKNDIGPVSTDEAIWNLFNQLFPDIILRKVEYATERGTLINVDYFGVKDDE